MSELVAANSLFYRFYLLYNCYWVLLCTCLRRLIFPNQQFCLLITRIRSFKPVNYPNQELFSGIYHVLGLFMMLIAYVFGQLGCFYTRTRVIRHTNSGNNGYGQCIQVLMNTSIQVLMNTSINVYMQPRIGVIPCNRERLIALPAINNIIPWFCSFLPTKYGSMLTSISHQTC